MEISLPRNKKWRRQLLKCLEQLTCRNSCHQVEEVGGVKYLKSDAEELITAKFSLKGNNG